MVFEQELDRILTSKKLDGNLERELKEEILRAFTLSKTPLGRKEGATFMTPESSSAADQILRGEKKASQATPKPKTI